MTRINPDSITQSIIVAARTSDKNNLIQMSAEDYRFAGDCAAPSFGLEISELLLSIHGLASPLPGQEDLLQEQPEHADSALCLSVSSSDEHVGRALARQARYIDAPVQEYLARLVLRGLAADERESVLDPETGEVLSRRSTFGKLWKSLKLPRGREGGGE